MSKLIISNFNGRLGNNILQLVRCVFCANKKKYDYIVFPKHNFFKTNTIIIHENKNSKNIKPDIKHSFFSLHDFELEDPEPKEMKLIFQNYILQICNINIEQETTDAFIMHLRGGDIFRGKGAHPYYVQPPLSYYETIIENNKSKFLIVSEDKLNPCVDELTKNKEIDFQSTTLKNDIETLCSTENLSIGFGTFGFMIYLMSKKLKTLHIPKYVVKELPKGDWGDVNLVKYNLKDYIKCGEWKNTHQQRQFLLDYSKKNIEIEK